MFSMFSHHNQTINVIIVNPSILIYNSISLREPIEQVAGWGDGGLPRIGVGWIGGEFYTCDLMGQNTHQH